MHSPDATFHNLAVLSYDTDRIMSLDRDHTKSERQYEMWFHNAEHVIGTCVYTETQTAVMTLFFTPEKVMNTLHVALKG